MKATDKESGDPRYSHNWTMAKRTFFLVFSDRIEIGSWIIPFNSIKAIILYRTKQIFIPVSVLAIQTNDRNYQVGFNPWVNPIKNIPIEVRIENVRLKYSAFGVAIRLVVVGYLFYWLWGFVKNSL